MSVLDHPIRTVAGALRRRDRRLAHRAFFLVSTIAVTALILVAFADAVQYWNWVPWTVLPFACANALWIAGGATTAVLGLIERNTPRVEMDPDWRPDSQTAILITVCGEDPKPLARYLTQFSNGMATSILHSAARVFVLSDTFQTDSIAAEDAARDGTWNWTRT